MGAIELVEALLEPGVALRVVEGSGYEDDMTGELGPELGEVGAEGLRQALLVLAAKVVVAPVAAGEADDGELAGEVAAPCQVIQGRHQLAMRQVAGSPEQDHGAGIRDAGPRQRLAQRVSLGNAH